MSEDECYFSKQSNNALPETPASSSSSNDYTYEENEVELEQEYIYDYEYQPNEYVIFEEREVEEIPYILPKPQKKIVWKRPKDADKRISKPKKRSSVAEEEDAPPSLEFQGSSDPADSPQSKMPQSVDKNVANFYLQDIQKRSESFMPKRPKILDDEDMFERLEQAENCDIRNRQCLHPTCNKIFPSLAVLAYHVSYAHQQYNGKKNGTQICLVCGATFSTGQGKLIHMTSSHKKLASEHGRLWSLQRPNIVFL